MTTIVSGSSITFNDNTTQNTSAYGGGFAFRNRIINGDCRIDQRNAGASVTPVSTDYTLDRWQYSASQNSKFSFQQNAASVTPPTGFKNYLGITTTSAVSVGASDYFQTVQKIEGFNVADLGWGTASASPVTLSFWVRSSLTGTFGGALQNSDQNRCYPYSYTISSANTWEYKTVVITGDTSGTWLSTNGVGIRVGFGLGVGSTYSGTAGTWAGSTYFAPTGATSVVGTNGATFYITGVQLEKGSTATSFDYRPYGTELALCQRYYVMYAKGETGLSISNGTYYNSSTFIGALNLPVFMRAYPTIEASTGVGDFILIRNGGTDPLNGLALNCYGYSIIELINDTTASGTAGNGTTLRTNSATAYLAMKAEL